MNNIVLKTCFHFGKVVSFSTFVKSNSKTSKKMIFKEQVKGLSDRRDALRRHL
jgi:hypothetical protein